MLPLVGAERNLLLELRCTREARAEKECVTYDEAGASPAARRFFGGMDVKSEFFVSVAQRCHGGPIGVAVGMIRPLPCDGRSKHKPELTHLAYKSRELLKVHMSKKCGKKNNIKQKTYPELSLRNLRTP